MTNQPLSGETVRRYDGRTEHAEWCKDHTHDGMCLDFLTGWEPVEPADIGSTSRTLACIEGNHQRCRGFGASDTDCSCSCHGADIGRTLDTPSQKD